MTNLSFSVYDIGKTIARREREQGEMEMDYVKQRAERLREELGRDITRQSIEKKLELCGYKVMYYGSEADSKGNQMLELLKFEDGIISR